MINEKGKVLVAMSGGVDSSVTAAILREGGYEVSGVFMRFWKEAGLDDKAALADANKVAQKIGIKLKVIDVRKRFKDAVVRYFLEEYQRGRTPNPCVFCNEELKFKVLLEEMARMGADFVATGHYARITSNKIPSSKKQKPKIQHHLYRAKDNDKDQSYFLYRLGQKVLSRIIFPLGSLTKKEVRLKARKLGLPVSEKKESQDVCFLKDGCLEEFLRKNLRLREGKIKDNQGDILGKHQGLPLYTIGQRRGVNIGGNGPYYVVSKDSKKNILEVTNEGGSSRLFQKEAWLEKVNWIPQKPEFPLETLVQTRYHNPSVSAIISMKDRKIRLDLKKAQRAVTPGQSAVFYAKDGELLGGGIIK